MPLIRCASFADAAVAMSPGAGFAVNREDWLNIGRGLFWS